MLRLPVELQTRILTSVLRSTSLRYGFTDPSSAPPPEPIVSLQLTCRAFYSNTTSWPTHTLFEFRASTTLVQFLLSLTKAQLTQLRHVRVRGSAVGLTRFDTMSYEIYEFVEVPNMFLGLQLDTLTVENPYYDAGKRDPDAQLNMCRDLSGLVCSDGWRVLRYTSRATQVLDRSQDYELGKRHELEVQLQGWARKMDQRDGAGSGAGVKLYRANKAGIKGGAESESTREEWDLSTREEWDPNDDPDMLVSESDEEEDDMEEALQPRGGEVQQDNPQGMTFESLPRATTTLKAKYKWGREVMVEVRRGKGANYLQDGHDLDPRLNEPLGKVSWKETLAGVYW